MEKKNILEMLGVSKETKMAKHGTGQGTGVRRQGWPSNLTIDVAAARASKSAPTTPIENISYECVVFDERQAKRRRDASLSPRADATEAGGSRMAERLLKIHSQLDKVATELMDLLKANVNTKVEIKEGIRFVNSLVSQLNTAEMRATVGALAGVPAQVRPCARVLSDASSQTEANTGGVSNATSQRGTQTMEGACTSGPPEVVGLGDIRRDIRAIQAQLENLAVERRPRARKGAGRRQGTGDGSNAPSGEVPEKLVVEVAAVGAPNTDQAWNLVARKGSQSERRPVDQQQQQQPPDKKQREGVSGTKPLRDRPLRVMVSTAGSTYGEVLKKLKAGLDTQRAANINWARKSESGNLILELKKGTEPGALIEGINTTLGGDVAKITAGSKQALEVKYLEEDVTEGEIKEGCDRVLGKPSDVKVIWLRSYGSRREKVALIECTTEVGRSLLQVGKLRIGWNNCRVEHKRERLEPCWRCRGYGHTVGSCSGPDRKDNCRRCGQPGHKEAVCEAAPRCMGCEDMGGEASHFPGSAKCQAYAEALKGERGKQKSGTRGPRGGD